VATPKNQSVIKAFAMLRSFRRPDEWLTSAELSRRAGLPEASGYRLIQTLVDIGAVVCGPRGRYGPGMLLVSLSQNVAIAELLREASNTILRDLSAELNLTVHVGILQEGMVTYVAKVGNPKGMAIHTRAGAQLEAYCSGLGKVLLAALPTSALEAILEDDLVALTPTTITDREALRAELDRVRLQGYALDDEESSTGLRCLAVPIRDAEGRTIAAISVSDDAARMAERRQETVRDALMAAATAIQTKVYPPGSPRAPQDPL
jgi:IclR family acetate operon transcriptional repressor